MRHPKQTISQAAVRQPHKETADESVSVIGAADDLHRSGTESTEVMESRSTTPSGSRGGVSPQVGLSSGVINSILTTCEACRIAKRPDC